MKQFLSYKCMKVIEMYLYGRCMWMYICIYIYFFLFFSINFLIYIIII